MLLFIAITSTRLQLLDSMTYLSGHFPKLACQQ